MKTTFLLTRDRDIDCGNVALRHPVLDFYSIQSACFKNEKIKNVNASNRQARKEIQKSPFNLPLTKGEKGGFDKHFGVPFEVSRDMLCASYENALKRRLL